MSEEDGDVAQMSLRCEKRLHEQWVYWKHKHQTSGNELLRRALEVCVAVGVDFALLEAVAGSERGRVLLGEWLRDPGVYDEIAGRQETPAAAGPSAAGATCGTSGRSCDT